MSATSSSDCNGVGHGSGDRGDLGHRPSDRPATRPRRLGGRRPRPQPRAWRRGGRGDRGRRGAGSIRGGRPHRRGCGARPGRRGRGRRRPGQQRRGFVVRPDGASSTRPPSTNCSTATCARPTSSSPGSLRAWPSDARGASSTWRAWPVRSVSTAAPPTGPPKRRSAP